MLKRRTLMASATALPLTAVIPAAWAATPKDTVVFASQIDDLITFDPGEAYEIAAQIILSSVYDRLVRYEAEDMTKLVGGVAESWTVSPDAKTYTFKLRPNQKFESGACGDGGRHGLLAAAGRHARQDPGLPVHPARLEQGQRQVADHRARRIDPEVHHRRELRPVARAAPDGHRGRLGCREEGRHGQRGQRRSRQHMAEDAFRDLGLLQADLMEGQRVGLARGQPGLSSRRTAHEACDRPPRPRARHPAPAAGERRHRHRTEPAAGSAQAAGREQGHQDRVVPLLRHLVHAAEPGRRATKEPEGPGGAEISGRLPRHGGHLPQGAVRRAAEPSCRSASSAPFPTIRTSSTLPRQRRCWPRPAIPTASSSGSTWRAPRR